jgi:hypothetical protein
MTGRERELEEARGRILQQLDEPDGHQRLSQLRQELRAIDVEIERLRGLPVPSK